MKSGSITRSRFHDWLRWKHPDTPRVAENSDETEKYLKQMAVEILAVQAAQSEGFDEMPFYRNIRRTVYANYLSTYYKSSIIRRISFTEKAAELKIIKLCLAQNTKSPAVEELLGDKMALASHIIRQYQSGKDFDDLMRKYSEDKFPECGSSSRVYPVSILDSRIFEKIKTINAERGVSEPVVLPDSVIIVQVVRWIELNSGNSEKLIVDKEIYDRFMEHLSDGYIEYIKAEKGGALNIVSNISRAVFKARNELLFKINGESFTSGELDELIDLFIFLNPSPVKSDTTRQGMRNVAVNIFNEYLLAAIADMEGVSSEKEFIEQWGRIEKSALAGAYKYRILSEMMAGKRDRLSEQFRDITLKNDGNGISHSVIKKTGGEYDKRKVELIKSIWEEKILQSENFRIYKERFD